MAFRLQDLMMDVRPGYQMANPECTCQITVRPDVPKPPDPPGKGPGHGPGHGPGKDPGRPGGDPCKNTVPPSRECPPARGALAADLAALKEQLRRLSG